MCVKNIYCIYVFVYICIFMYVYIYLSICRFLELFLMAYDQDFNLFFNPYF